MREILPHPAEGEKCLLTSPSIGLPRCRFMDSFVLADHKSRTTGRFFGGLSILDDNQSVHGRRIMAPSPVSDSAVGQAFPLGGGVPVSIGNVETHWSPDGSSLSLSGNSILGGRSYIVPLPPGQALPRVPANGFSSEEEVARLPGARRIDEVGVVPGPSPGVYAFYRGTTPQRNLYRIPIP